MKRIAFFDGDGTLWYPMATRRTVKPHWVYRDLSTKDNSLEHLTLTPGAKEALAWLSGQGIICVVISASPHDPTVAERELRKKLSHFGLLDFIYSHHASDGGDPNGKATVMLEILQTLGLKPSDALMIGDSYFYDYLAAQCVGIDALFIENSVAKMPDPRPTDLQTINEMDDLIGMFSTVTAENVI